MHTVDAKKRHLLITSMTLMLLAVTLAVTIITITTSDNAFARNERYASDATSQAAAVNNDCLNPIFDSNTIDNAVGVGNCGGTISQQDESGSATVPITSQTANPTLELQRATTTTPPPGLGDPTCEDCFNTLSDDEQASFLQQLPNFLPGSFSTIEELCNFLNQVPAENLPGLIANIIDALNEVVDDEKATDIEDCLNGSLA